MSDGWAFPAFTCGECGKLMKREYKVGYDRHVLFCDTAPCIEYRKQYISGRAVQLIRVEEWAKTEIANAIKTSQ
jgi:hypothetical protein